MPTFTCPKCGSELAVKPGTQMAKCSFCGTISYIDRSSALFFYILPFDMDEEMVKGVFKRWAANPAHPKDMEGIARITTVRKEYFPVFKFRRTVSGKEQVVVKPARSTLLPGMRNLVIPPGDMQIFDSTVSTAGADVLHPDLAVDSYLPELPGDAIDQSVVYFPIYEIACTYKNREYAVVIDGFSGNVSATEEPTESSVKYGGVLALSFILGALGVVLGFLVTPIFFLLIVAGFLVGKILGHLVVKRRKRAGVQA